MQMILIGSAPKFLSQIHVKLGKELIKRQPSLNL